MVLSFWRTYDGMFAFAYNFDDSIELVRDTIWIKPLYYVVWNGIFWFSSEIKWLVALCKVYKLVLVEVLPWEIVIFNKKSWKVTTKSFSYKSYTWLSGYELLQESFSTSLIEPTSKYVRMWKKVAVLLSGGLDSSVLLYSLLQNKKIDRDYIKVFSLWIDWSSDREATRAIEKDLWIDVVYVDPLSWKESIWMIEKVVEITESPLSRVVKVGMLQYSLAKKIREEWIDIVVSGEWSDEIFYWYERFYKWIRDKKMITKWFTEFFQNMFFHTLLQRLDRVFSHFTIEWRVPFLDQELVAWSQEMPITDKINNGTNKYILREYAKKIWVPEEISNREKEKMTKWVTSEENNYTRSLHWYLENICYHTFGEFLSSKCLKYYKTLYYIDGKNIHSQFESYQTEEDLELILHKHTDNES